MKYLAIDIGASSGRIIVSDDLLNTEETYRFKNQLEEYNGHLIWDIDNLYKEVLNGLKVTLEKYKDIERMSIDTWGVDYVLLDQNDKEIKPCYGYRDGRTAAVIDKVHNIIPFKDLYKITGCQFQSFNTIYQLYDDLLNERLKNAKTFLMIPEYLMFKLTGIKAHEYTNATTTGLIDTDTLNYSTYIIDKLGFNKEMFEKPLSPGSYVGKFKEEVSAYVGKALDVYFCATHDTGSAVEGLDVTDESLYISSGTWSLLGVKSKQAIKTDLALKNNYSNEGGVSYIRFQKNIMGLWIIQNLSKELNMDFVSLINEAKKSNYKEIFDCNDECFLAPKSMYNEIIAWFERHNIAKPKDSKDVINSCYHSLAYSYDVAIKELEAITNKKYTKLIIGGGGAKNKYLNELTEHYTKKEVIALPIEATAIGNIKVLKGIRK